jgi:hypothetical protein
MRPQRILQDGAACRVTSQIDRGATALEGAGIKRMFPDLAVKTKKKFDFKRWNFAVTGSRIHFLIKPGKGVSLSKITQWMMRGERFFSRIIRDERDFAVASGDY